MILVECSRCGKRFEVLKGNKTLELSCGCGETLTILPWLSYRQTISESDQVQCSLCMRRFDLTRYRDRTEIACNCGNLLVVRRPGAGEELQGRRKIDRATKLLETKLHGLADTCRLILSVRDLDKLLLLIVRLTTDMMDAEGSTVVLRDRDAGDLVFHSVVGEKSDRLAYFYLAEGEGIAGSCVINKASIIANDARNDSRFSPRADSLSGFITRSILCIPLVVEDECIGALEIVNKKSKDGFDENDLFLGEAVASQIAIAIHNVKLGEAAVKAERLAAIGVAITGVAHCVKNMLNGLQGGLYITKRNIEKMGVEIEDQGIEMIESNLNRLKELVEDMLFYSKDREPEYQSTDLNALVHSVVELMQVKAAERKVGLQFDPDPDVGNVEMDPKGINSCVHNLISNALDACEQESASVKVRTGSAGSDEVVIEVADEGCGMDKATLRSIFQPFFSKKESPGAGLGLSMTDKIVKEHGGTIDVESEPGRGSVFRIYLPVKAKTEKSGSDNLLTKRTNSKER